jgi:hypothetical protein
MSSTAFLLLSTSFRRIRLSLARRKLTREPDQRLYLSPFCLPVILLSVHPSGRWMVGAVGIEFIKAQNPKELCGMCCSRKSFVV